MKNIHIGKLIQAKIVECGLSVAQLAAAINCDRTNIYKIFQRKSIDIEQLIRISQVLNYNFIEEVYLKKIGTLENEANFSNYLIEINHETISITKQGETEQVVIFRKIREK